MDQDNRVALWNAHFEADFRYSYFLALKELLAARIMWLSIAIALLSCGPLSNYLWQVGIGDLVSGTTGAVAGLLGVYLGVSGLPRTLATATRSATEWANASRQLKHLWTRSERGDDVWAKYLVLDEALTQVDAAAINDLSRNRKLEKEAWEQSRAVLAA